MIPVQTQRSVETSPTVASASFGISQNDVAHILTMLRDTLYSDPRSRSGGRLATFLGLSDEEYLARFDRANLCHGVWSDRVAKATARRLAASPRPAYVLLGEKVCAAFDVEYEPDGKAWALFNLAKIAHCGSVWTCRRQPQTLSEPRSC